MWVSERLRDVSQVVPTPVSMTFLLTLLKPTEVLLGLLGAEWILGLRTCVLGSLVLTLRGAWRFANFDL